jgi:hypothetical protein
MYVDNELSEAQRTEVEAFVQQNPDLTEELTMLQESVLLPDEVTFFGKESLYKDVNSININNYEEYFLLDVDNELSTTEKADVEKFVLQHPKLQDEFTLLHETKLEAEVIEFKDKAVLYRTEEKERRVIPMRFMKFAIAASVIGLIATLWIVYPGDKTGTPTLAATEKKINNNIGNKRDTKQQIQPEENIITEEEVSNASETLVATQTPGNNKKPANILDGKTPINNLSAKQPEKADEMVAYKSQNQETEIGEVKRVSDVTTSEPVYATNTSTKNLSTTETSFARPAVYKEVEEDDDDEKSFLIGSAEINKNKLRGLIKKASTLFDKKAKSNDSDRTIQIAGFEIKTK